MFGSQLRVTVWSVGDPTQNLKEGVVCSTLGFKSITQKRFKPIQWFFFWVLNKSKKRKNDVKKSLDSKIVEEQKYFKGLNELHL